LGKARRGTIAKPQQESLRALSSEERATLERLVKRTSERVDRVRRARALWAVAAGVSFAAAARAAGLRSATTVADLVGRFNASGLAVLSIGGGCGRKPTDDAAARAEIVATAQRPPERRQDGTATWSLNLLQRALRKGTYPRIGTSTIRRVLEEAGSSSQRTRNWCPTGTAQRVRQSGVVTVTDPQTGEKGIDRAGGSWGRTGRARAVGSGRSRSLPDGARSR
jgi:transposase